MPYDLTYKWSLIKKQTSKQNITRDSEIKKKVTVIRGEVGGDKGGRGGRVFSNMFKGHMDKIKEQYVQGWEVGMPVVGGKWIQLYLNNNKTR